MAACYVQWDKLVHRKRLNRVMAFTTVFLGITITIVSDYPNPHHKITSGAQHPIGLRSVALSGYSSNIL